MITVLVKYKVWSDGGHPLLDGNWIFKSKIVTVEKYEDLNSMFKNIVDVKTLGGSKDFNCIDELRKEFLKQILTECKCDNPHHPDPSTKKSIVTKEEIKNRNQHGR